MSIPQHTYRTQRLSKSDFLAGLQCSKNLWLRINEPDADELEIDEELEALFEQGRRVGELARTYVPGGTLIDYPYYEVDEKLRATKRALDEGVEVIYEAAFAVEGQFVAVDILERTAEGFSVTEVKSSTKVKDEHLIELGLQAHVLSRSGIEVTRLQVMHLNRVCVYPNLENLFVRDDVTEEVQPLIAKVEEQMRVHAEVLSRPLPGVQIGPHCSAPNDCAFKNRCWADVPLHHVTTIHAMRAKKAFDLVEQGFTTIQELPSDFKLSDTAKRQRRAVIDNRLIVEPTLVDALKDFPSSIGFLDFETVSLAIPVWDGCRPYDAVPVEFSLHVLQPDRTLTHAEWLADGPGDPREAIALALIDACSSVERIAAYNSGFEGRCLRHLADALPNLANDLNDIESRLIDLLPVVRNHIYHPEFYGSFGLKQVFPALTGESSYETLEVTGGELASWLIQSLLLEPNRFSPEERTRVQGELLAYCRTDTEALAKLLNKLRELGLTSANPVINLGPAFAIGHAESQVGLNS